MFIVNIKNIYYNYLPMNKGLPDKLLTPKNLFAEIAKRWFWLLPFIISILPYFALKVQINQFIKNDAKLSDNLWMDETDSLVDKIKEASA